MPRVKENSAMPTHPREIVIIGITEAGRPFRPSDWAERLCGCLCLFGEDQKIRYSPYLKPIVSEGTKCVVVDRGLEDLDPVAFCFLMSFAKDNELKVRDGREGVRSGVDRPAPGAARALAA